jgi:hypothetical protein
MTNEKDGVNHPIFSEFNSIKPHGKPEDIKADQREETLEERFARERREWEAKIKALSQRLRDIFMVAELQVDIYSARQELVEYYHYLTSLVGKKNAELRRKKRERHEYYTTGYDYKLDKDQKQMYIMTDLEDIYIIRDEIENHQRYISATMNTVDNIIFGIKHRISLEEYKRTI